MEIFPGLCRWVKEKRPLSAHGIKTAFPDFLFCSVHAPHLALRVQRDLGTNFTSYVRSFLLFEIIFLTNR